MSAPVAGSREIAARARDVALRRRAAGRLVLVASLTSASNVVARARRLHDPQSIHLALRHSHRLARVLLRALGFRVEVEGHPPDGLAVVVSNHRSYVDIPLIAASVRAVFLAKEEIRGWPLFGTAARFSQTVFVRREDPANRRQAVDGLRAHLDQGTSVVVFPEGTTSSGPGVLPFRRGAFRLAVEQRVPVVPVAIRYGDPRDCWFGDDDFVRHFLERFAEPRPSARMTFGPPMQGDDAGELAGRAEDWIRETLGEGSLRGSAAGVRSRSAFAVLDPLLSTGPG